MNNQRNAYLDYIKGIVIVLVVFGHCIHCFEYGAMTAVWDDTIFKIIYIFHMPLFFWHQWLFHTQLYKKEIDNKLYKITINVFAYSDDCVVCYSRNYCTNSILA